MGKIDTKRIGDAGEDEAVNLILNNGYELIERNFRTRFGEVDIIAKENKNLAFIEVKKKNSEYFGSAAERITGKKLWKLVNMATVYIQEKNYKGPWRIDAVLIDKYSIKLVKNLTSYDSEPSG